MDSSKRNKTTNTKSPFSKLGEIMTQFVTGLFILAMLLVLYGLYVKSNKAERVSISSVLQTINSGQAKEIIVNSSTIEVIKLDDIKVRADKERGVSLYELLSEYGVATSTIQGSLVTVNGDTGLIYFSAFSPIISTLLIIGVMFMFLRTSKGGSSAMTFGQTRAKVIMPDDNNEKVTFDSVAGAKEAKEELLEIVDFLKSPKKFADIGATIPKGVLLMGAPGTGKTMLARAVAGEAGVPFYHLSGSEFEEMFVGVGAARVRDLFENAKKTAPSIIFIDEIDAVGKSRDKGVGGHGEAREQTLNQILVEMDGFEKNQSVIVMAATNRSDVLDAALLRPGRFDRRVTLDMPDRPDRLAILEVHVKNKKLADDVNLVTVSERTPGFSGADLASVVNEGAIRAARAGRTTVTQVDLVSSIEKVMLGPERKSHVLGDEEKRLTAYHEAGHAVVASLLPNADPVHKISIIARGHAGGYTLKLPIDDKKMMTKKAFIDDIAMTLGGYAAEEITNGDVTTGPSNDLQVATVLARDMITKYGMSNLGVTALTATGQFASRSGYYGPDYSQAFAEKIDSEVERLVSDGLKTAKKVLVENKNLFVEVAEELLLRESLEQKEYEEILSRHGVSLKQRLIK